MTERDKAEFQRHVKATLEYLNTIAIWVFIALAASTGVSGGLDTVYELVLFACGVVSGAMSGLNLMWGWSEFKKAHALAKRTRS